MKDNVFIDTNILVYANSDKDVGKQLDARRFFEGLIDVNVYISTQVLSESFSALRKCGLSASTAADVVEACIEHINVLPIAADTVKKALAITQRYNFSYWDSLILSAALLNDCNVLYSEDMSDGQVVEGRLTIINPLKKQ